jgi:HSP20 family protein
MTRTRNRGLNSLQREIDRVFDAFFPSDDDRDTTSQQAVWAPRTDLVEGSDAYRIHLDLPGVHRDDVTINYQDNQLTISGERRDERTSETDERVRVERAFGHFYRAFTLPRTVDPEGIEATHENGVLTVRIPKSEESRPRQIDIQ